MPLVVLVPINVVEPDYNSREDSNYEAESPCDSTEEDEEVPNTPTIGGPRLVLLAPIPIHDIAELPSFFQQLDLDTRHVEDPMMEHVVVEYNTDDGVEFMLGHRMRNREAVFMAVKNYSIRRNFEYRVVESDRLMYHCR
ncbi:hypothetical protein PIB30_046583 [Stylosanthes scabra]|uniref:Uncharacterized protein n=1 Tax=Stylosanthes scabra TaxID=79078 RepID=A0ABU6YER7_9FABA|nr:hypothetical protein [Stylosanthes scabra]